MPYKDKEKARAAKNASYTKNKEKYLEAEKIKRQNETDEERSIRLEYHKEHYKNNKEHYATINRNCALKRKYGINQEEYNKMLISQDGKCAICETKDYSNKRNKMLCVDHNHITGQVRQLLCDSCNMLIGNANENENILYEAINYIRKHSNDNK